MFIFIISTLFLSLLIDILIGELPVIIHPVVILGKIIDIYKNYLIKFKNKLSSLILYILVVLTSLLIVILILLIISFNNILFFIVFSILLSSTFSIKLLISSADDIKNKLNENINIAREAVSYLVSRNTEKLSELFIISATIETLSENITDSYVAPIFYYMIFSIIILFINKNCFILLIIPPIIYRISNTLDAMVGYKNDKLKDIGYIPAKFDDILNYIPARITGLIVVLASYILKYNYKNSYLMYKRDSRKCPSPNSGFTMATFAGALDIQLIKKNTYILGDSNKKIEKNDISKAIKLSKLTIILFTLFVFIFYIIMMVII